MRQRHSRTRVGIEPDNSDAHPLAKARREAPGPLILKGDARMIGRTCRSLCIASIGMEKIIPHLDPHQSIRPSRRVSKLPNAFAHGSRSDVCPMKINIHEQIRVAARARAAA
jgi:hypothetical protein